MARIMTPNGLTAANRLDEAGFGVVYGSISVMAVIMSLHTPLGEPGRIALMLFATVLAVVLAKAFAENCQTMLTTGRAAGPADYAASWQHSRTALLAANAPAAAFLLAAFGVYSTQTALLVAQWSALLVLAFFGGRIGWRVRGTVFAMLVGAAVTGGLGLLLSAFKYLVH